MHDNLCVLMGDIVYYAVVAVLNLSAVVLYAITSFGNGIVYNSGWQLCYRLESSICSGNLAEAVVHVSVATVLLVPMQAYILRAHINWKLVGHLALTQQIGIYLGMRILFQFTSVWLQRSMGAVFHCNIAQDHCRSATSHRFSSRHTSF